MPFLLLSGHLSIDGATFARIQWKERMLLPGEETPKMYGGGVMKQIIVLVWLSLCSILFAQQIAPDRITGEVQWSGEILVRSDITVARGATLYIAPGTRIKFEANQDRSKSGKDREHIEFIVLGTLIADGLPGEGKIIFTSAAEEPRMYDWYGIVIKNLKDKSLLKNCVIEYAYKGITCYGSSPEIISCEIRYNQYAGISCEVRSNARIQNNTLIGNDFAGLVCELGSNPVVENSIITQNLNGVIIFDRSAPDLGHANPGENQSFGENFILNNFESNIYNHSSNDIYAQNNLWNTTQSSEITAMLIDQEDNRSKGKIIFLPVFRGETTLQARVKEPAQPLIQPVVQQQSPSSPPETIAAGPAAQQSTTPPQSKPDNTSQPKTALTSTERKRPNIQPETGQSEALLASADNEGGAVLTSIPEQTPAPPPAVVQPETLVVYREVVVEKPAEKPAEVFTVPDEPIIEALLDGGRRKYFKRVKPEYPPIYLKTKFEGKVLLQVIVGLEGQVESFEVLRSDGEFFTRAAVRAVKKFRYVPGTFKGQPVKYKIIEPFYFRLN